MAVVSEPAAPVVALRRRGASKAANWRRPGDIEVSVIPLELDLTDPATRRRVEAQWATVFRLRRAVQADARARTRAYHNAPRERETHGPAAVRARLGLSRKGLETAASAHVDRSRWMRAHVTKALALHVADEVWETVDRHLFLDKSGKRHGPPRVGDWWGFTRIPGRARSHTKIRPAWETWLLVGTLQGNLDGYAVESGVTVAEVALAESETSVLVQPKALPAPSQQGWWTYTGPLAVVFTGLPAGDIVMPVRLPQGAGAFPRLAHYLANPSVWHKIDLVRVRDRRAPGGWRHYAHLTVLAPGYQADTTITRRAAAPRGRVGGVDGNVSNLAVVSMPSDPNGDGQILADYVCLTDQQKNTAVRAAAKSRSRQRALDRSRRTANPDQYHGSVRQQKRAARRAAAGLPERQQTPGGARRANKNGVPTRAYRKDSLTDAYRQARADHAAAERGAARAKRDRARDVAARIVAVHGPNLITEHVDVSNWARMWGRGIALFSPGMLLEALSRECVKAGGQMLRASVWTTAVSQHCVCGAGAKKPLSQRTHYCPDCGLSADRDLVSAAMAATVTFVDPSSPGTARIDPILRVALARRVAAQQEALSRSTAPTRTATNPGVGNGRTAASAAGFCREPHAADCPTPTQTPHRGRRGSRQPTGQPPGRGPHDPKSKDLRVNS